MNFSRTGKPVTKIAPGTFSSLGILIEVQPIADKYRTMYERHPDYVLSGQEREELETSKERFVAALKECQLYANRNKDTLDRLCTINHTTVDDVMREEWEIQRKAKNLPTH